MHRVDSENPPLHKFCPSSVQVSEKRFDLVRWFPLFNCWFHLASKGLRQQIWARRKSQAQPEAAGEGKRE